ncbi:MAG: leucine dehydrogenase [Clostridia bacterium]|nr:leucine dehydrogenase [Clostridia bacterium]
MSGCLARMAEQGFEELVLFYDAGTGLKTAIAIHSTARGPALGGTRMWVYPNEEAAIEDVMCLARGMSYKSAAAELPIGGGKGVIIGDPGRDKSEALFRAYGRFVEKLNGRFITAADMGIEEHDLDCIHLETRHVIGGSALGSPSPLTAYGTLKGIKACVEEVFGSPKLEGLIVAVQGVGSVGMALCKNLAEEGALLIVTDLDQKKVREAVECWNAKAVAPDEIYAQKCDIFAPCGGGGAVNRESLPRLQCRIVAGAANNVLKEKELGAALKERGILYAPDYIINAGGIIFVEFSRQGEKNLEKIKAVIDRIEGRMKEIFRRSREQNLQPEEVADLIAEEKLREKI